MTDAGAQQPPRNTWKTAKKETGTDRLEPKKSTGGGRSPSQTTTGDTNGPRRNRVATQTGAGSETDITERNMTIRMTARLINVDGHPTAEI